MKHPKGFFLKLNLQVYKAKGHKILLKPIKAIKCLAIGDRHQIVRAHLEKCVDL